jgi:Holliday junction DNA helicase RuvA
VTEALTGLGFATRQAEQAVEAVLAEADSESVHTPDLLRSALARLGRNR